jgi:diacylglycerol kinase (ATP)
MRIGVLSNLRAGRVPTAAERVRGVLAAHPEILHLETRPSDPVGDALEIFEHEAVELLVLNGGDGTLARSLTEILGSRSPDWRPLVAPLRGGRTNTSALSLGIQRDPARGLAAVIEAARGGRLGERTHERPVLRIDCGGLEVHYGMFFGAGILYNAIRLTQRSFPDGRAQGYLAATTTTTALVARAAFGKTGGVIAPEKIQVALDGAPVNPQEFLLAMATTLDRLFMRINPFWGTGPEPIRFSTVAAQFGGWRKLSVLRGLPPGGPPNEGYIGRNVQSAALRLDCGFTVDGELIDPEPDRLVKISAEDRVRFVRA